MDRAIKASITWKRLAIKTENHLTLMVPNFFFFFSFYYNYLEINFEKKYLKKKSPFSFLYINIFFGRV
jgi:hypothetical protein